jgi:HSP20 family protein
MNTMMPWENKWSPFREMEELHRRLASLVGRGTGRLPVRSEGEPDESITLSEWSPVADITEDDTEYLIKMELPEVRKEDLKVNLENGVLTISGERKFEKEERKKRYHRIERAYGSFSRGFVVPDDSAVDTVRAEFKDGVLNVHLAKAPHAKPRSIDIKIG